MGGRGLPGVHWHQAVDVKGFVERREHAGRSKPRQQLGDFPQEFPDRSHEPERISVLLRISAPVYSAVRPTCAAVPGTRYNVRDAGLLDHVRLFTARRTGNSPAKGVGRTMA